MVRQGSQKNNAQIQQLILIFALHENNGWKPNNRSAGICEKVMKRPLVHNAIHVARWGGCSMRWLLKKFLFSQLFGSWKIGIFGKGTQLAILVSYKELIFRDQDKIIDNTIRYFSFHLFVYISKRKIPMQKNCQNFSPKLAKQDLTNECWDFFGSFSAFKKCICSSSKKHQF